MGLRHYCGMLNKWASQKRKPSASKSIAECSTRWR
jgi:hypothetical protein